MNNEEHDDLWYLLGKNREQDVSPYFSRNVLRAIRTEQPKKKADLLGWMRRHWTAPLLGAAAVAVVAIVGFQHQRPADPTLLVAQQVSSPVDLQVISHLDDLLDSERNSVWLESPPY